jgi:hypothetical protein
MKKISLVLIRTYQFLFSFDHSFWGKSLPLHVCRFEPTCSEYTYQAIDKYGFLKGSGLGTKRILRCHPFAKGGYDPLQ